MRRHAVSFSRSAQPASADLSLVAKEAKEAKASVAPGPMATRARATGRSRHHQHRNTAVAFSVARAARLHTQWTARRRRGGRREIDRRTDRPSAGLEQGPHARTHALRLTAVCLTDDDESIDVAVAVAVRCRGESSRERQRRCRADIVRGVHDHGGSNCSKHHAHTRVSSSTSTCRTNHASQATSQSANKARCQKASFVRVSPRQQQARAQTALAHPSALPSIITSSSSSNNRK
ncbi:hypothetical protein IWX49DRAFT_291407 [Phyllosticta citricarpa]